MKAKEYEKIIDIYNKIVNNTSSARDAFAQEAFWCTEGVKLTNEEWECIRPFFMGMYDLTFQVGKVKFNLSSRIKNSPAIIENDCCYLWFCDEEEKYKVLFLVHELLRMLSSNKLRNRVSMEALQCEIPTEELPCR